MSRPGKFRALLATLRIANAPSVVSNVWLGYMVGWMLSTFPFFEFETPHWLSLLKLSLAGVLLYFAGNLANDWHDREWDASRRPERALPKGQFQPSTYIAAALALAISGVLLALSERPSCGIVALGIVGLILVYTSSHKRTLWSVIPMGLCRAGLYFLGFLALWPVRDPDVLFGEFSSQAIVRALVTIFTLSMGLFSYIAGLSLSARYEGMTDAPRGPRVISLALLMVPIAAMSWTFMRWFPISDPITGIIGMLPFTLWLALCLTRFRKPIPRYVSALLAGIPLVDFIAAAPIALGLAGRVQQKDDDFLQLVKAISQELAGNVPQKGGGDVHEYSHLVAMLLVPLAAFVVGRLLQKVAPAT